MKNIFLICFLAFLFSCKQTEKIVKEPTVEPVENLDKPVNDLRTLGIVRKTENCGFVIKQINNSDSTTYFPTNLPENMKVDGLKLKFLYTPLKISMKIECTNMLPVELKEPTPYR